MERNIETRQGNGDDADYDIMMDAFVDLCDIEAAIEKVREQGGTCEVTLNGHRLKIAVEHIDPVRISELMY